MFMLPKLVTFSQELNCSEDTYKNMNNQLADMNGLS